MTTYSPISNTEIDQDSPITQPLVTALRDNPIAISEGASSAPFVATSWHPYDAVTVGDSADGIIYDFSVDGAASSVESPTFEDGYEYAFFVSDISHSDTGTSRAFQIELYQETAAAYVTAANITSAVSNTISLKGMTRVAYPRIDGRVFVLETIYPYWYPSTFPATGAIIVSNFGATDQVETNASDKISKARLAFGAGNIDAGTIAMYRRREYITG